MIGNSIGTDPAELAGEASPITRPWKLMQAIAHRLADLDKAVTRLRQQMDTLMGFVFRFIPGWLMASNHLWLNAVYLWFARWAYAEEESRGVKGYQLVSWFPEWQGVAFHRDDPRKTDLAYIYAWYLWFGFWELRKWSSLTLNAGEQEADE